MEKVGAYTERVTVDGEWRAGNPATGERATPMLSTYFNMLQRELLNILSAAGIAPDLEDETQLSAAIQSMISGAIPPISFLNGIQVYDQAGTYEWDVPEGVTKVWVIVTGGGGASGSSPSGTLRGPGGGAGGTAMKLVDLTGEASVTITVGAAGTAGSIAGGTSSFGAFVSAAGGGAGNQDGSSPAAGGQGGDGIGGDLNLIGGDGGDAFSSSDGGGGSNGGGSYWGGGPRSGNSTAQPAPGTYGTGAGAGTGARATAASGVVVIQW